MRWPTLVLGVILIAAAVGAFTRVADTREGLVAEVVTLLAGVAGVSLVIYGLAARSRRRTETAGSPAPSAPAPRPRSRNDIVLGAGGIALAVVLLGGLSLSGGFWWGLFGLLLLLPMIAGSIYLCVRYVRARS